MTARDKNELKRKMKQATKTGARKVRKKELRALLASEGKEKALSSIVPKVDMSSKEKRRQGTPAKKKQQANKPSRLRHQTMRDAAKKELESLVSQGAALSLQVGKDKDKLEVMKIAMLCLPKADEKKAAMTASLVLGKATANL